MANTKACNLESEVERLGGAAGNEWEAWSDSLPVMAWRADADGVPRCLNGALRNDVAAAHEWPFAGLHPDGRQKFVAAWERGIKAEKAFELECRQLGPDGAYRWRRLRVAPQQDESGQLLGWQGAVIDIDEQRSCERQLEELEQQRHHFLAVLGHELRNPLATVVSALQVLEALRPVEGEELEMREIIHRQAQLMKRLVDDLLDVSRIARNKISLRLSHVDLAQLVREAVNEARRGAEARGINLQSSIPEGRLECAGDAPRLRQALDNVLGNALRFTDSGGRVEVKLSATDAGWATLIVEDTGIGMTPAMLAQLFSPFVQAETSLARSQGGLGLGLALAKGLIELHGGTIAASSAGLQAGSVLSIRLPLKPAIPAEASAPVDAPPLRVLVIEDRRDAALPLIRLLRRDGHSVELAEDGLNGLELAGQFKPQVVICDIGLPGIDGHEVARRIRRHELLRNVYLVALTGYGLDSDRQKALEAGFDHYLRKPIDFAELRAVVDLAQRAQSSAAV